MDGKGCYGCAVGSLFALIFLVIIIDSIINSRSFQTATDFVGTILSFAVFGLLVYFVIEQIGVSQRKAYLRKVLAQLQSQELIEVRPA